MTDKYCILWCCEQFFREYTADWDISILVECRLGNRYFAKIESNDEQLTDILGDGGTFTDTDRQHVGHILRETGYLCKSKFDPNRTPCVDAVCNLPHLDIYSKYICALMCCVDCPDPKCPSKLPCRDMPRLLYSLMKMVTNIDNSSLSDQLEQFYKHKFRKLIEQYNIKEKLPKYIRK
jgi:hypothetical protein